MISASLSRRALLGTALAASCSQAGAQRDAGTSALLTGVNLAGLEFNSDELPGEADTDYVAPTVEELAYYSRSGANLVRLPFLWERLQPVLGEAFNQDYLALIDAIVAHAQSLGMRVVLDAHQYGRRTEAGAGRIIGETRFVTAEHFAEFWAALARHYAGQPELIFGLQNEPHDLDAAQLLNTQNTAIATIRAAGARHLLLVSGSAWSGAHSWVSSGNNAALEAVRDPADHWAYDVHQYLDADSSGTHDQCVAGAGAQRLAAFTDWARANGKRGFLGEFGSGPDQVCTNELDAMLSYLTANRDVWLGWAYWAGGPWWDDDYPLSIEPHSLSSPQDRPQMAVLRRHFQRG